MTKRDQAISSSSDTTSRNWFCRSAFWPALAGGVLVWAALPPVGWWPLAWMAPVFWLTLVAAERLPGRRPYLMILFAGFLQWLAILHGVRLAHITMYGGWLALAFYTSLYLPAFIAVARVAVHRFRWPLPLAAAVTWVGLELARGHLLTGFSIGLLGHTQVSRTTLIQLADAFGAYGVSFLVVFFAACLTQIGLTQIGLTQIWLNARPGFPSPSPHAPRHAPGWRAAVAPLLAIAVVLIAARLYGTYRLNQDPVENMPAVDSEQFASREANSGESASGGSRLKVALVQCAKDIVFEYNPERDIEVFDQCRRQSMIATEEHPDLQLLVWPESAFTEQVREVVLEGPVVPPPGLDLSAEEFDRRVRRMLEVFAEKVEHVVALVNRHAVRDEAMQPRTHLIVGCEAEYLGPRPRRYNSALHLTPEGTVEDRYYKMHRVAFGEYLPLGDQFPGIYAFTPMAGGLTAGAQPAVFSVHGWKITPTICFESTVPHLIRNQIRDLTEQGEAPDMLVNVTNDGWFRNTSLLDLHFACAVFRSIENRIPVLVAANSGISVWLDGSGRTRAKAPRRVPSYVYAEVTRDERNSLYQRIGDAPAGACLLATLIFAFRGLADARTRRKRKTAS